MPRIMAWNVEEFGAVKAARGNYAGVVSFLDILLARLNVDVLVIEEFRQLGIPYLFQLRNTLDARGGDWYVDYLPGAVNIDNRPNLAFADLAYTQAANSEGYAVLWRQGQIASIANGMSYRGSLHNPNIRSHLSLVTLGRRAQIDPEADVPIQIDAGGGNANHLGFPLPACANISSRPKRLRSGRSTNPRGTIFSMTLSRCPCYCQVNAAGGGQVPFVVYHAPNGDVSSFYGTLITGLAAPLQGAGHAVVGGDFNIVAPAQVQHGFDNFTDAHANNMVAGTQPVAGNYPSSMVKYVDNVFNPQNLIAANVKAQAQGQARDQLFYRLGAAPAHVGIADLIGMLRQGDPNYNANLATDVLASVNIRNMVRNAIANNRLPPLVRNSAAAIADLRNTFTDPTTHPPTPPAAAFANYRTIAIFLNCFISDHLPLYIDV